MKASYYRRARATVATLAVAASVPTLGRYSADYFAGVAAHWRMLIDSQYLPAARAG